MMGTLKPYPAYKDSGVPWLGQVPAHWEVKQVKRHYAIQLGKMLQTTPNSPDNIEVPYLKAQHIQWFSVRTSDAPRMWASPRDIQQFGITAGDLLVCEGGEGGRCGIVKDIPEGFIIQNALHRVRPRDHCRNDYLQYVMSVISATGRFNA
jgi:type I restriction enzyme S subunit